MSGDVDTDELRRLAEAATEGPWRQVTNNVWDDPGYVRGPGADFGKGAVGVAYCKGGGGMDNDDPDQAKANAEFIAAANPAAMLALLDRLAALSASPAEPEPPCQCYPDPLDHESPCSWAGASPAEPVERDEPLTVTREEVVDAIQTAWDDFVGDTGCFPDAITVVGRGPKLSLEAGRGNWATFITDWLNAALAARPVPVPAAPEQEVTASRGFYRCDACGLKRLLDRDVGVCDECRTFTPAVPAAPERQTDIERLIDSLHPDTPQESKDALRVVLTSTLAKMADSPTDDEWSDCRCAEDCELAADGGDDGLCGTCRDQGCSTAPEPYICPECGTGWFDKAAHDRWRSHPAVPAAPTDEPPTRPMPDAPGPWVLSDAGYWGRPCPLCGVGMGITGIRRGICDTPSCDNYMREITLPAPAAPEPDKPSVMGFAMDEDG